MLQLKKLRKRDGITQTKLSEYMGITQATLSGWENEKFEIDTESLKKLARYFNVSVDYMLGLEEEKPSQSIDQQLDEEDFAFFGEVKELTTDEKEDVLNFINFIKSKRK